MFGKIIILFDEFGRYIEYTAANPSVAGDSSLQQIFEAIQNADGNILFDGFIQSDLNAYLSRIDKSSNIIRYVGRYEISDKYYISSNFETILANLITKKDEQKFSETVEYNIDEVYRAYNQKIHANLIRWNKSVPTPAQNSATAGLMPVRIGTKTVAPNIAKTCCIPRTVS